MTSFRKLFPMFAALALWLTIMSGLSTPQHVEAAPAAFGFSVAVNGDWVTTHQWFPGTGSTNYGTAASSYNPRQSFYASQTYPKANDPYPGNHCRHRIILRLSNHPDLATEGQLLDPAPSPDPYPSSALISYTTFFSSYNDLVRVDSQAYCGESYNGVVQGSNSLQF